MSSPIVEILSGAAAHVLHVARGPQRPYSEKSKKKKRPLPPTHNNKQRRNLKVLRMSSPIVEIISEAAAHVLHVARGPQRAYSEKTKKHKKFQEK